MRRRIDSSCVPPGSAAAMPHAPVASLQPSRRAAPGAPTTRWRRTRGYRRPWSATSRARSASVRGRNPVSSGSDVSGWQGPHISVSRRLVVQQAERMAQLVGDDVAAHHRVAPVEPTRKADHHKVSRRGGTRKRPRVRQDVLARQQHHDVGVQPRQFLVARPAPPLRPAGGRRAAPRCGRSSPRCGRSATRRPGAVRPDGCPRRALPAGRSRTRPPRAPARCDRPPPTEPARESTGQRPQPRPGGTATWPRRP